MSLRARTCEILVVGSLNHDITVQVPRLPVAGETVLGISHSSDTGGKGANQAVAAARLGRRVAMVGRVGRDDAGAGLLLALRDAGVDTSLIAEDDATGTGLAAIAVEPAGENVIVVSPGANANVQPADLDPASRALAEAAVVLLQLELPLPVVVAAAEGAAGTVVLNPAPARELPQALLDACDVLVPNRTELALLAGGDLPTDLAAVAELARHLDGPDAIVVTLGADGALLVESNGTTHVPAPEVEAVDATGAGDAFCGALADALVRGQALGAAVHWAVAAGAVTATRSGAQSSLPTASEVEVLM